jgi:hypothetical protein
MEAKAASDILDGGPLIAIAVPGLTARTAKHSVSMLSH